MSTLAYGVISAQRQAAPEGSSKDEESPGFGSYVDVVAALVPVEVLAANAVLLPVMTSTSTDDKGASITTITEPGTLQLVFWLSIAFSVVLYVISNRTRANKEEAATDPKVKVAELEFWGCVRALIPAGAYVAWTMLQKSTAFDAIDPSMGEALRFTIAVFGAIGLGVLAKWLSDQADGKGATVESPPSEGGASVESEPVAVDSGAAPGRLAS